MIPAQKPLLLVTVALLLPASAHAEIATAESIEWVLATSDRVVVGNVVQVDKVTSGDHVEYEAVTVAVSRTLKGVHVDRRTFLLHNYNGPRARQWMDDGIPMLFCLVRNDSVQMPFPREQFAWVLREDGDHHDAVVLGKSKHDGTGYISVLTRDFQVLTEPSTILKWVERCLKATEEGGPLCSHTLDVPGDTAVHAELYDDSSVELIVPVDDQLEALGRTWCRADSGYRRAEGAKVLQHFKNETNIRILQSLLSDPSTAESSLPRKKRYYVREAAFAALQEFGVNVDRPILEEPVEGPDDPDPE